MRVDSKTKFFYGMGFISVGIKDILHPMVIKQRSGKEQSTVANFNMYVNLPHNHLMR